MRAYVPLPNVTSSTMKDAHIPSFHASGHFVTGFGTENAVAQEHVPLPSFPIKDIYSTSPGTLLNTCAPKNLRSFTTNGSNGKWTRNPSYLRDGAAASVETLSSVSGTTDCDKLSSVVKLKSHNREVPTQSNSGLTNLGFLSHPSDANAEASVFRCSKDCWNREKKLLEEIVTAVNELVVCTSSEWSDYETISKAFDEANVLHNEVSEAGAEAKQYLNSIQQCNKNEDEIYKVLMAEEIDGYGYSVLDEALEKLSRGLQAITLATYKNSKVVSRMEQHKSRSNTTLQRFRDVNSFKIPLAHGTSSLTGQSEKLCSKLIERLQELRTLQSRSVESLRYQQMALLELQRKVSEKLLNYREVTESVATLEQLNLDKHRRVELMCGEGDYSALSVSTLQDLNQQVVKTTRKIVAELAIRDMRTSTALSGIAETGSKKNICLVCFERPWDTRLAPCGHHLCGECGARLNFCPQCRLKIESRQSCS